MRTGPRSRRWLLLAALAPALVLVVMPARPAAAHPWGTPPTAVVEGDGDTVIVHWRAEPDDSLLLGVELGLVDPLVLDWDWDGAQPPPESVSDALLPPSSALEAYLLERIRVVQGGVTCQGQVEAFGDFVAEGATTTHRCPEPVTAVELEVAMLHDIHQSYRTFAESRGEARPRQAAFTVGAPSHEWTFGEAATAGGATPWAEIAVLTAALAIAGLAGHRRRRRLGRPHDPEGVIERMRVGRRSRELTRSGSAAIVPVSFLAAAEPQPFGWLEAELLRLVDTQDVGGLFAVAAVLIAFGIGAAHAMAPGHGKAMIGAYLVGTRGRRSDAVALGAVVAVMHCASVVVFGGLLMVTLNLHGSVADVLPWMGVVAGVLVTAVGTTLVLRQAQLRSDRRVLIATHAARHTHHDIDQDGHHHSHDLPEGVRPLSRRGVVALGMSGGLLPSPSAFVVLATAILSGRALFGLALVGSFSLGLATSLTLFGLAALKGGSLVEQRALKSYRFARLASRVPLMSAVAVLAGGLWITFGALLKT